MHPSEFEELEEATARRAEIAEEADFYGSMDGASKFVKGDAIAGILILAINIIGGLIIGIAQHSMAVGDAAQTYILLSIGDGLVAQIPSLLLSIATAIIVTRVSSKNDMARHISQQVHLSRAWIPTAAVVGILGLVPGMPNGLFLLFALFAAGAAYFAMLAEGQDIAPDGEETQDATPISGDIVTLEDVTDYSPVSLQLGYGLISLVDDDQAGPLVSRITSIRREVSKALGFVVPSVRIRDDLSLPPNQYRIRIGHTIVGEDTVYPDRKLALPGEGSTVDLDGIKVRDPSFGVEAIWIRLTQQTQAEANDYVVIEPISVIATHMSQLLTKHAADLIGQDDVQAMLDNLGKRNPQLVQSIVPKLVPLHTLTEVLRLLLVERIPISDLRKILEGLSGIATRVKSPVEMSEALRPSLVPLLIQQLAALGQTMPVMTLSPEFEQLLLRTLRQGGDEGLVLDGGLAKTLLQSLNEISERLVNENKPSILVVAPAIRRHLADFVRTHVPQVVILGFTELPENRTVEVVATIGDLNSLPSGEKPENAEVN